jgi:hypothetical protein
VGRLKGAERAQMKIIPFLGGHYFKKEDNFNIREHVIKKPENFQNIDEVADFMSKEVSIYFEKNKSPWLIYFWENFEENHSLFLLKCHHSLGDGISLNAFLSQVDENPPPLMAKMKAQSFCQKVIFWSLFPILGPISLIQAIFEKADNNVLNSPKEGLCGIKKGVFSDRFGISDVKIITKRQGGTINDFMLALISSSLAEYIKTEYPEAPIPKTIKLGMPFNIRVVDGMKNMTLNNSFTIVNVDIPLMVVNNYDENTELLQKVQKVTKKLHGSIMPLVKGHAYQLLTTLLPDKLLFYINLFIGSKLSIVFSNVPGPSAKLEYSKSKLLRAFFFVPTIGRNSIGISVNSYDKYFQIGCCSDLNCLRYPEKFIKICHNKIKYFKIFIQKKYSIELDQNTS